MFRSSTATALALVILTGCPFEEPPAPVPVIAPAPGSWEFRLSNPSFEGHCEGIGRPADFEDLALIGHIERLGRNGVRIDLDGVILKGDFVGSDLFAEGTVIERVEPGHPTEPVMDDRDVPEDEDGADEPADDGDGADAKCEIDPDVESEPADRAGLWVTMDAELDDHRHMFGELSIDANLPDVRCDIVLDMDASWLGEVDRGEPVMVYETESGEVAPADGGGEVMED